MGEAFLHGHNGMSYSLSASFASNNNVFIVGQPSNDGRAVIVATLGGTQVLIPPEECTFTPSIIAVNTTAIKITKKIGGTTRSVTLPIVAVAASSTFNANSWGVIAAAAYCGIHADLWSVGDEKTETINGTEHTFRIIGFNHNSLSDDDEMHGDHNYNKGRGKAAIALQFKTPAGSSVIHNQYISDQTKNWTDTKMYTETLPALYNSFPQAMKNVVRKVKVFIYKSIHTSNSYERLFSTSERITLIDSLESRSVRALGNSANNENVLWFLYSNREDIAVYDMFAYDGYVGLGTRDNDREWTRQLSWDGTQNRYYCAAIITPTSIAGSSGVLSFITDSWPYRPIFSI